MNAEKKVYQYNYPMPSVTVDMVLFSPDRSNILCIKRKNEPFKGFHCLPGGFMNIDETLAAAAVREPFEETGIVVPEKDITFVGMFDAVKRDTRNRVLSACFTAQLKDYKMPVAGDDAAEALWVIVDRLVSKNVVLGFDHYDMVMQVLTGVNYFEH